MDATTIPPSKTPSKAASAGNRPTTQSGAAPRKASTSPMRTNSSPEDAKAMAMTAAIRCQCGRR